MQTATLDRVAGAISDPTRRAILERLARGSACAGELAAPFAISQPAVSRHLRVLEEAGLVRRARRGREHVFDLDARPLHELHTYASFYERFWTAKVDRLERHLQRSSHEPE